MSVRNLYALKKAPFFDPPLPNWAHDAPDGAMEHHGKLDRIVRAFHNSAYCAAANQRLIGRRTALQRAWQHFIDAHLNHWPQSALNQAKQLDYAMRTAIFEGHLDRGCSAYGACERNIIALSLRNRARGNCSKRQGCQFEGDYQSVATRVSQYNIWDEYLTQISGLTSCFLRRDLEDGLPTTSNMDGHTRIYYRKIRRMYRQNLGQIQKILFGRDRELQDVFPNSPLKELKNLRHYYHAPAMGQCFPNHDRVEYLSGAIAWKDNRFALLANTRIRVDQRTKGGYFFRDFVLDQRPDGDVVRYVDDYPGFIVDGRKISLKSATGCSPYGVPRGCRFKVIGRYRKTPSWLRSGKPLALTCRILDQRQQCQGKSVLRTVTVGGFCDTQMQPIVGVR